MAFHSSIFSAASGDNGMTVAAGDEAAYIEELGVPDTFGEEGYTTRERLWGRPTFELNGMTRETHITDKKVAPQTKTRPKADHTAHGTEIVISKLKPEQRGWLARGLEPGVRIHEMHRHR